MGNFKTVMELKFLCYVLSFLLNFFFFYFVMKSLLLDLCFFFSSKHEYPMKFSRQFGITDE